MGTKTCDAAPGRASDPIHVYIVYVFLFAYNFFVYIKNIHVHTCLHLSVTCMYVFWECSSWVLDRGRGFGFCGVLGVGVLEGFGYGVCIGVI